MVAVMTFDAVMIDEDVRGVLSEIVSKVECQASPALTKIIERESVTVDGDVREVSLPPGPCSVPPALSAEEMALDDSTDRAVIEEDVRGVLSEMVTEMVLKVACQAGPDLCHLCRCRHRSAPD